MGLSLIWADKTGLGVLLFSLVFLIYISAIFKNSFQKANSYFLYFIIFTIPMPFILKFKGKDAITLTTLLIIVLFAIAIIANYRRGIRIIRGSKIFYFVPLAIMANMIASFALNPFPLESSIRFLVANISGIILYFLILDFIKKQKDFLIIIDVLLCSLMIQSGICFLQLKYPELARTIILPFATRIDTGYAASVEGIVRGGGTIGDYELLAEILLIGAILSLGLIYRTRKYVYFVPLLFCLGGIIFTKTRSSIMVLVICFLLAYLFILLSRKDYKNTSIKTAGLILFCFFVLYMLFPQEIGYFVTRLDSYFRSSNLISAKAIHRDQLWQQATNQFLQRPSLLGSGMYDISAYRVSGGYFHSLYLSILYTLGIIGLALHVVLWLSMFKRSLFELFKKKEKKYWYLLFFLSLGVFALLIDEVKVEYLRSPQTIQFAWFLYGLLVALLVKSSAYNENLMVPSTSI